MLENDDLFNALADSQRRRLLVDLLNDDLKYVPNLSGGSQEIAEAHDALLHEYLFSDRESTRVDKELLRMHCIHLPELANDGFIEWDQKANVVTKGPRFYEMEPILELVDTHRERGERPVPESPVLFHW